MIKEAKFQIGKQGITEGTISTIESIFKTHKQLRISVLQSAGRNKEKTKEIAEELSNRLDVKTRYRIIGFTIILRKQ